MKIFRLLAIILFFVIDSLSAQKIERFAAGSERFENRDFDERFFYSVWINPVQFDNNLILNYKIRYDFLLFEKALGDTFKAQVKVILELSASDLLSPIRNIDEVVIKSTDFNQTISKEIYYTSNFSLNVPNKKFKATLILFDEIRNKEIANKNFILDLSESSNFEPVFIKESDLDLLNSDEIKNRFYNFIPFGSDKYVLVLPDTDDFSEIEIKDNYVDYKISEKINTGYRYSIFPLDTLDLIEGEYDLKNSQATKSKKIFVRWIGKPEYLKNPEKAFRIMKYLFENDNIEKELIDGKDRVRKFYSIWKKFDPTPNTPFNELLAEFYRRADYASFEFKSVSQPDGALTDRGKIYIIYGKPDSIERNFSKDGRALEIWTYNSNRNLKFTFFDENKNGNYILQQ
ncbi:MAG: GWxTD domain-containing protein [Ignavibacteria bacterium]